MKSNLISAIAGWKSAALLALVAMVAAVAFSGVLTTTQTAEAANVPLAAGTNSATAAPGDVVHIVVTGAFAQVSITDTDTSASFVANDGQSINCADGSAACDTGDSDLDAADTQNAAGTVVVQLKIDDDAPEGYILLSVNGVGAGATAQTTKVITVSKAGLVGSLEIKHATPGDATVAAAAGTANLTITVKDATSSPAGMDNQMVTLITSHGTIGCDGSAGNTQTCNGDTGTDGMGDFTAVLTGGGVEGIATVRAILGTRSDEVQVTLFGTAKNLEADPEQGSVEIGGSVYIVLTVTDGAGNPVQDAQPQPAAQNAIVGPSTESVSVTTSQAADDGDAATSPYNVNKDVNGNGTVDKGDIPACGPVTEVTAQPNASLPVQGVFASTGTNAAGQCVVEVTAPDEGTPATTATRGEHTLNFALGSLKASATIEVAGKPDSITTSVDDNPTVEPSSVTEITVSVFDDENVLVGISDVKVRKVGGDGLIEDAGEGGTESTSDGQSKFTFIAPSTTGSSEILITSGAASLRLTINVGEPAEEEPEGPAPTWNEPLVSGTQNVSWQGEDGADPSAGAAEGVTAIWRWTGDSWQGYFPDAAEVPGGNNLESLENGAAYWVIVE